MTLRALTTIISELTGQQNVIPVPVLFVRLTGDHASAYMLTQILYWSNITKDPDGWFYKTHEEWMNEVALRSADQVRRCVLTLKEFGVETCLRGLPAKTHYRLNRTVFLSRLVELLKTQHQDVDFPDILTLEKSITSPRENPTSIYNESNTTSKPTTNTSMSPDGDGSDSLKAQILLEVWNTHRGELPKAQMTDTRKAKLKTLVRKFGFDELKTLVEKATKHVAEHPFWKQEKYGFDNLLASEKFVKHAESYDAQQQNKSKGGAARNNSGSDKHTGLSQKNYSKWDEVSDV